MTARAPHPYELVSETAGTEVTAEGARMVYARYAHAAELADGKRVLEVACGSGQGLGLIGSRAKFLVGGDINPALLRAGKGHYGARYPLVRMTADRLPFRAAAFDLVTCFEASYYFPSLEPVLDEITRVLRPGGEVLFVNANPDRPDFIRSPYSVHYHSAPEFHRALSARGYTVTVEGAFPESTDQGRVGARVRRFLRILLERLHLVPRTLKGRALLKRLVNRQLLRLPAEIPPGYASPIETTRLNGDSPAPGWKVIYVRGIRG